MGVWSYCAFGFFKTSRCVVSWLLSRLDAGESFPTTGIRTQCVKCTNKSMYQLLWTLILAPAHLIALFLSLSSAGTVCDASYYGNPDPSDCLNILRDNSGTGTRGLESHDRRPRLFYTGNLDSRPSDVSPLQWRNKLNLAETIYTGQ